MGKVREYQGKSLIVRYEASRCIHAAECVSSLPAAFDPNRRPWIDVSAADAEDVAATVRLCPTGALTVEWTEDAGGHAPTPANEAQVVPHGPIYVRGHIKLVDAAGASLLEAERVALCRCGASAEKPFCDGSHERIGFVAE